MVDRYSPAEFHVDRCDGCGTAQLRKLERTVNGASERYSSSARRPIVTKLGEYVDVVGLYSPAKFDNERSTGRRTVGLQPFRTLPGKNKNAPSTPT
jgi:hypothetical protein